jgi:hypothetical protein
MKMVAVVAGVKNSYMAASITACLPDTCLKCRGQRCVSHIRWAIRVEETEPTGAGRSSLKSNIHSEVHSDHVQVSGGLQALGDWNSPSKPEV